MKADLRPDDDPALTTGGAARLLGVAVSTAQLWIQGGALASWTTPGGHRRVRRSAVLELLRQRGIADGEPGKAPATPADAEFLPAASPAYPVGRDEAARLRAVAALGIIDTPAEHVFDRLTWLAAQVTGSPIAALTLLTSTRQWFKSRLGVNVSETPREWAFCRYAILQDQPFMVEDASRDARFKADPHVAGAPHLRFYASAPLIGAGGHRLGALCVLDLEARRLRASELRALSELAAIASEELRRRS